MKKLKGHIKDRIMKLQRALKLGGGEQLLSKQLSDLRAHMNFADDLLLREYERLNKALEKEKDPVVRYKIMSGIVELEAVLKKRRIITEYLEC